MDAIYNRFTVLSMDSDDEDIETSCRNNTPPYPPFPTPTPPPPPPQQPEPTLPPVILPAPSVLSLQETNNRFISIISEKDVEALTNVFTSQRPPRSLINDNQYRNPRGNIFSKGGPNKFSFRNTLRTDMQVNTNSNAEFPSIGVPVDSSSNIQPINNINFAKTVSEMAERQRIAIQEVSRRDNSIDALSAPVVSRFRRTLEDILADESQSTGFTSMNDSFSDDNNYTEDGPNTEEDL